MNAMDAIVSCKKCGAKNRVKTASRGKKPVCGKCHAPLPLSGGAPPRVVEISDRTFESEVLAYPGPVLVDCWAPWCGPCHTVAPVLDALAREYGGKVKITKLNIDRNPLIASRYRVMSVPTMLFFKNGRLMDTVPGAIQKTEIQRHISAIR